MQRAIQFVAAIHRRARALLTPKLRSQRSWLYRLALASLACGTLLSVPSFAQNPPLSFGDNFFVTGDYVVAGAHGVATTFSSGYAIGTFTIPDANPGIHGRTSVPPGAEVVGAFVYWQTVENAGTVPGQPGTGENGFFRPLIANGPAAPGYPLTGVSLPGHSAVSWSSGGCSEPAEDKITRTYRANVLGALPQDAKGNVLTNGKFEIRLPSVGPQTPLTIGATLVIIYRVLSPNVPLSSIVIYNGAFGQSDAALNMTQTVQGFYDAGPNPVSKLTLIAGHGLSNKSQTVYLDNIALPSHAGHNLPPFPGYYGNWDNPTWTFGDPNYPEIANPVPGGAASVPSVTTEVAPSANGPGCLSWGAVIFSTTVDEPDSDGLLRSWKTDGGYCDASINGGACKKGNNSDPAWVALPGAMVGHKDLFLQLDYVCSKTTGIDSCQTGDGTNYSFDPRPSGAAALVTQAFLSHGVYAHINPTGPLGPLDTIQPVHAIQEETCSDVLGPPLALCPFPNQAGVAGWKGGYVFFKNQLVETSNGNVINCLGANPAADCHPRFQRGRKDSWHYALFAHAVGRPEWKIQDGTLTSVVQSGHAVTFTTSTPLGKLTNGGYDNHSNKLPDPHCANGRVSVYYADTNSNLNGTFCIASSTAPGGDTFTITVPGPSENAPYTLLTDPYLVVAPGQTGSASGISDVGGADSLITLGLWGDPTLASSNGQQENTIAGTFMHEIGHSIGLTHGGFYYDPQPAGSYIPTIEPNCKPNFQSVMNYFFQVDLLNGHLDYSEQQLDPIDEAALLAGVTYQGGPPLYASTKWYTPIAPQNVGTKVAAHCDGTPRLPGDPPATFLVPGTADPTSPSWDTPASDVDFDGIISPTLRGYDDWAPTGITTGIDLRQIGATSNGSVFNQDNFFGGGINLNGGGINLNGGGINLNGGGQNLNGGGINLNGGGINLNGGGINLNGGGINLNGGGQNLNGGGEIDQQIADSYTRPPTGLMASEEASQRFIDLSWTAPTFGQIGTYKIYRSADGGHTFTVIASVNGNPPGTTYRDTVTCNTTGGYQYFVTAVLSNTSTNPGQESVPSNIATTGQNSGTLNGCYIVTSFSSPANAVQGSQVTVTWTLTDDFNPTAGAVARQAANTIVAIGPLPNSCAPGSRTTLLADGIPTNAADRFSNIGDQFTFTWNSTDAFCAGSYTFELDLDHVPAPSGPPAQAVQTSPLQLAIDVNDTDSTPHITTLALNPGTVGLAYSSNPLTEDGGTAPFSWTFTPAAALPPGISQLLNSPTLSGTTCMAGLYKFTAMVTDSKSNSGTEPLTLQINVASTTTSVASSANPSVYGQTVTFTAIVKPQYGCTPTGTVTFEDGGTALAGTSTVALSNGMASFTTTALQLMAGLHSITAVYSGDPNFYATGVGGSTATALPQTVNQATTNTTVMSSLNASTYGQAVTFTTTVAPEYAGTPTGTVTFEDGGVALAGSSTVALSGGIASFITTNTELIAGPHSISAVYLGDPNFYATGVGGSTAQTLTQTVNQAGTVTAIALVSPSPAVVGQSITVAYTLAIAAPGAGTPTGTVTVATTDGSASCMAAVPGPGACTLSPATTTAGSVSFTVTYSGDHNFAGSGTNGNYTVNIYVSDVAPPPFTAVTTLPSGVVGSPYSNTVYESGGVTTGANNFSWAIVSGSVMPGSGSTLPGLGFQANAVGVTNGTLSGTPTAAGTFTFTANVVDSAGNVGTQNFTITVFAPESVPYGLVSWYPFEGNANDLEKINNGSVLGTPQFVPAEVDSGLKPGAQLSGSLVAVPDSPTLALTQFTIGAWVRVDALDNVETMQIVWKGNQTAGDLTTPYSLSVLGSAAGGLAGTVVGTAGPGKVLVILTDGTNELDIVSTNAVPLDGKFHYLAVAADGQNVSLYIDGVVDPNTPASEASLTHLPFASANPLQIGGIQGGPAPGNNFDGVIDELQIWNRPLTAAEVSSIFNTVGEYQPATPPAGLVSWWPAEGNYSDIVGANNGAASGGVGFAPGEVGQAFSFNGAGTGVDVPNPTNNLNPGTSDFTVDFWMNTSSVPSLAEYLLTKRDVCGNTSFWSIQLQSAGTVTAELGQDTSGTNYNAISGTTVVNDGKWHHVALVRQSVAATLYIDGLINVSSSTSAVTNISNSSDVLFGNSPCVPGNGTQFYQGLIDEVGYFNRALTTTEIQSLVNAGGAGKAKP